VTERVPFKICVTRLAGTPIFRASSIVSVIGVFQRLSSRLSKWPTIPRHLKS